MTIPTRPSVPVRFHESYVASESLASTRAWARRMHGTQKDKNGLPYLTHLDAVALNTKRLFGFQRDLVTIALLHDILEDTAVRLADLEAEDYSATVIDAVLAISKGTGEKNYDYLTRVLRNEYAAKVKLADLTHNTHPDRMAQQSESTRKRLHKKYLPAIWRIEEALSIPHTVTFTQAWDALHAGDSPVWRTIKAEALYKGDSIRFSPQGVQFTVEKVTKGREATTLVLNDHRTVRLSATARIEYLSTSAYWTPQGDVPKFLGYNTIAELEKAHPEVARTPREKNFSASGRYW